MMIQELLAKTPSIQVLPVIAEIYLPETDTTGSGFPSCVLFLLVSVIKDS